MPNIFNGQISDTNGRKLEAVNVIITGPNIPPNTSTKSNKNGEWSISLTQNVNDKDITITFSKKGLETKVVKGPAPTAIIPGYIDPDKGGSLNLQSLFASGKYKVTSIAGKEKDILDQELEDLFQFIKKNPGNVKIKIRSSESKVTNSDNEDGSRTQEFRNQPGSLAKARAEALQQYITDFINNRINSDTSIINPDNYRPVFDANEANITRVGSAQWEVQNGVLNQTIYDENQALLEEYNKAAEANGTPQIQRHADLPKYKNDQYVALDVELILVPKTKDCTASNLYLYVMYLGNSLGGGGHECNAALYKLYANGELIYRTDSASYASLNNQVTPTSDWSFSEKKLYENKVKKYDNTVTNYNKKQIGALTVLPYLYRLEKDKFIDPDRAIYPPVVTTDRFNAFLLTSDLLKKLTDGKPDKKIKFEIACWNPEDWFQWDYNCHKGVGSFKVIKVDPDEKDPRYLRVTYSSDIIKAATPNTVGEKVELLTYDLCADGPDSLKFNEELIKKASDTKAEK